MLSTRHCGFSRKEIGDHIGISSGSGLTKILNNLEASDFIQGYKPIDAEKGEKLYRLIDPFCHFFIRFVEKRASSDESGKTTRISRRSTHGEGLLSKISASTTSSK